MIRLRFCDGLRHREIAERLNIPRGTSGTALHNALKKLLRMMQQEGYGPEEVSRLLSEEH